MKKEIHSFVAGLGRGLVIENHETGHGRNLTYQVTVADGTTLFVKQLVGTEQQVHERMQRLLLFHAMSQQELRDVCTPRLIGVDESTGLVAHEWIADAESPGSLPPTDRSSWDFLSVCAKALASLHLWRPDGTSFPEDGIAAEPGVPFEFITLSTYVNASSGELQALRILQNDPEVGYAVRALQDSSRSAPRCAVHGDLRLDQFLIAKGQTLLVDWEEFRLGDAAKDFGALIGELLYRVALRIFTRPDTAPADLVALGEQEFDSSRPFFATLWKSYGYRPQEPDPEFVRRVVSYAGWHLFDRMLAVSQRSAEVAAPVKAVAGIGRAVLLTPESHLTVLGPSREP